MIDCPDCSKSKTEKHWGIYQMTCFGCRERLLLDEPCKTMRQGMAKSMQRWGEVPEWKVEPNCGCKNACKRRQYQKG